MTAETLKGIIAMMADPTIPVSVVAKTFGIGRSTIYQYVDGEGTLKPIGQRLLCT